MRAESTLASLPLCFHVKTQVNMKEFKVLKKRSFNFTKYFQTVSERDASYDYTKSAKLIRGP